MKFKDKENKKNNDNKEGNLTYRNATIANTIWSDYGSICSFLLP